MEILCLLIQTELYLKISHYIDNTYALPEPAKVMLTLETGEQPRSNIEVSVPDNLKNKIRVNGDLHTLFPGQPAIFFIEFTDLNLNSEKPSNSGDLTFYSDGEFCVLLMFHTILTGFTMSI